MTVAQTVNIAAALKSSAEAHPDKVALIIATARDKDGTIHYVQHRFAELQMACQILSAGLQQVGIQRGTRTVLMAKPSFEFFALMFAMFQSGIVPVLIDPGMGLKNLKVCLEEAEPEAFVGISKAHVARVALGWGRKTLKTCVTVGRKLGWSGYTLQDIQQRGQAQPQTTLADTRADETAALLFTSGSTGVPKGVVYSHGNFAAQIAFLRQSFDLADDEVDLATFPPFALFDPALGMTSVVPWMDPTRPADVDPKAIFDAIERFKVTHMFGSPALLNTISRAGVSTGQQLPSLRRVLSAGAPVPYQVLDRMRQMLAPGVQTLTPYGATECLPISVIGSAEILDETRHQTETGAGVCIGRPVHGLEVQIIPVSDTPIADWAEVTLVKAGEIGEIVVKGPNVTRLYFNRPAATELAKIKDADGSVRHRMGDLGYFDAQGRLWFCGRKAHRIITERETLYADACEAVFNTHPDVYRTGLVSVSQQGQVRPVLCVELESESRRSRDQIRLELLDIGARYRQTRNIRTFLFLSKLPVDIRHNAKIFREELALTAKKELSR
ncbi:MAG: AMP-binding protein [Candidatus Sericytochromatia bacterium]|nr:AMP-binding protein [Candidatus Sericytochromatia bacterium]